MQNEIVILNQQLFNINCLLLKNQVLNAFNKHYFKIITIMSSE